MPAPDATKAFALFSSAVIVSDERTGFLPLVPLLSGELSQCSRVLYVKWKV